MNSNTMLRLSAAGHHAATRLLLMDPWSSHVVLVRCFVEGEGEDRTDCNESGMMAR